MAGRLRFPPPSHGIGRLTPSKPVAHTRASASNSRAPRSGSDVAAIVTGASNRMAKGLATPPVRERRLAS
jgi:hypothetical protein